jgi:hypothetical protein
MFSKPTDRLFAFWGNDLYPYVLGDEVVEMDDNGNIKAKAYGGRFKPIKILPLEAGQKLMAEIKAVSDAQRRALKAFNKEWLERLKKAAPFVKE